jgi:twitching motility protein PilT
VEHSLHDLLREMRNQDASDLHLRVGMPATYRINGELIPVDMPPLTSKDLNRLLGEMLTESQRQQFEEDWEFDVALDLPDQGRYRVNLFRQRNEMAAVFRAIKSEILDFSELHLPSVLADLSLRRRGLILVTGTAGSGKSTTLATMIDHINENNTMNIVTIEDPIEFIYQNKKSIIAQREVGGDTRSFHDALRHILRQDPNVILIGEIRDTETMSVALKAADSGHLVLSTLHTIDAPQTVNRIISFFPLSEQHHVRLLLASTLQAVISMRLLPRADGQGRIPAVEVLVATATVRDYLLDPDKSRLIPDLIEEGTSQYGMQSFDQSLLQLYQRKLITLDTAKKFSTRPGDFELKVEGIVGTSDRSMRFFDQTVDKKTSPESGEPDTPAEDEPKTPAEEQ